MAGAFGRGLEKFGNDVSEVSNQLYRRQETQETSEIYATMADKRAELTDQLTQQTADGSLDSEKFKNDYNEWVDKQADQYQTASGKNYFTRQASRLGGTMLVKAARGQALVASNNAKSDFQNGLNTASGVIENDPHQFADVYESNVEHLSQLVDQGLVSAKDEPKFREAMGTQLAQSALRGHMQSDPDEAEHMLKVGAFDQWLNAPQKRQMETEIRQAQSAAEVDSLRQDTLAKKAQAAAFEKWGNENLSKVVDGSLTTKDILKSPGTWEQKERWLGMSRQQAQLETKTDPSVMNDVYRRSLLPSNDPQRSRTRRSSTG
jgi:hypothetical protein